MKRYFIWSMVIVIVAISTLIYFLQLQDLDHWATKINDIGSLSSPRAMDLNMDGILDIVVGGAGDEYKSTEFGLFALDGLTGAMLWQTSARNQMVGSPIFNDVTNDRIPDVFIGGRSAQLMAINGANGNIIWEYLSEIGRRNIRHDTTLLNFYTPQIIPDMDNDGVKDLLVSFGGYPIANPMQKTRPSGKIMIVSGKDGSVIAEALVPDKKETYMTSLLCDLEGNGSYSVIFGTGGETIGGGLYKTDLESLLHNNITSAKILHFDEEKGYIAPPILADINNDGVLDIVANSVNGKIFAIDGMNDEVIWELSTEGAEAYASMAAGFFTDDDVPDFISVLGIGIWPNMERSLLLVIDGVSGTIEYSDSTGFWQNSSPVVADFNNDGKHEILFSFNNRNIETSKEGEVAVSYNSEIKIIDIWSGQKKMIDDRYRHGFNLASTPLLTDLDNDHRMDLIVCRMANKLGSNFFKNLAVERIEMDTKTDNGVISWGSYMGSNYNGKL